MTDYPKQQGIPLRDQKLTEEQLWETIHDRDETIHTLFTEMAAMRNNKYGSLIPFLDKTIHERNQLEYTLILTQKAMTDLIAKNQKCEALTKHLPKCTP